MKYNFTKEVLDTLNKCYQMANIKYNNEHHIVVAAEKQDQCYLYNHNLERKATIWEEPGGTMSIIPLEDENGSFLATQKFHSPNDSASARIVYVSPKDNDYNFNVRIIAEVPFAHRFDVLKGKDGTKYILVCALKSGHDYKDDWTKPGKTYFIELPKDLENCDVLEEEDFTVIQEDMLKNHGYYKHIENGVEKGIISCDSGVYLYTPPKNKGENWHIEKLIDCPSSDATLIDLDGDGVDELVALSPFHGHKLRIYKKVNGKFELEKEFEEDFEFLHGIWSGKLKGENVVVLGHRRAEMKTFVLYYDNNDYKYDIIDEGYGAANINYFVKDNKEYIIAANRETDQIALYIVE